MTINWPIAATAVTTSQTDTIVLLRNVNKSFRSGLVLAPALRTFNLSVLRGEFVAVTGAAGSGKSTLLRIMAGLDLPHSGEVYLGGVNVMSLGEGQRDKLRARFVGIMADLYPSLKAIENVEFVARLSGRPASSARSLAEAALANDWNETGSNTPAARHRSVVLKRLARSIDWVQDE